MEGSTKLLGAQKADIDSRAAKLIRRLGICALRDVDSGDCGFSAPSPEMLPTC